MDPDKLKRFISSSSSKDTSFERIRSKKMNLMMSGDEVRKMYEEILSEVPKKVEAPAPPAKQKIILKNSLKTEQIFFTKSDLFRNIGDADKLQEILTKNPELINERDQYNWTALMMAACDGKIDSVLLLLEAGCDRNASDGKGNTALSLAMKKGHTQVIELFQSLSSDESDDSSDDDDNDQSTKEFYCEVCKEKIHERLKKHEASTLHQFNRKSEIERECVNFGISSSNRGYQLMLKQGWSTTSGLGPEQKGRKYPVKTVLRKNRQGLGMKQTKPRVSHFAPHDMAAIKYKEPLKFKSQKEMKRERVKNRQLELKLRRELS